MKQICHFQRGAAAGAIVGFGLEIGHGASGLETTSGTRAVSVSETADALPLSLEPAEIGSRDDPALYGWAAEEIRRRAEASQLRGLPGGEVSRGGGGGLQLTSLGGSSC